MAKDPCPQLNRRSLIRGAAGLSALAASAGLMRPQSVAAADAYDTLRQRWTTYLTGGTSSAAEVLNAIDRLDDETTGLIGLLDTSPGRVNVFTDLPLQTSAGVPQSAAMATSYQRLSVMATSYRTQGSDFYGDSSLVADILSGLQLVYARAFDPSLTRDNAWFRWEISGPQALNDCCVLIYDSIPAGDLANYMTAVEFSVPTVSKTGGNRVDLAQVVAIHGVLTKSSTRIAAARTGLPAAYYPDTTTGDGFYADGSFLQHGTVPYTGGYGRVLVEGVAALFHLLEGSTWAITAAHKQPIFDKIEESFAPFIFDGRFMDAVRGRIVSRWNQSDIEDGLDGVEAILILAKSAPTATAQLWRTLCKGWLSRNWSRSIFENTSVRRAVEFKALLDDASVIAASEPETTHVFPSSSRAVHRRPGWAASVSAASSTIAHYESINNENLKGWCQGSHVHLVYDQDHEQFADRYWAAVDPLRLPGSTAERKSMPTTTPAPVTTARWRGGATMGNYGTIAQWLVPPHSSSLRAWKSTFFLGSMFVCTGSKISCGSSAPIETTLLNRNLHATGTNRLLVDGSERAHTIGTADMIPGSSWAHLEDVGGVVLLDGNRSLVALRDNRSADWSGVNTYVGGAPTPVDRRFMTLWLDHGPAPANDTYGYAILPGYTASQTAAKASDFPVDIDVTNDRHLIHVPAAAFRALNAFAAGSVAASDALPGIQYPELVSIVMRSAGTGYTLSVSQPARTADSVSITIEQSSLSLSAGTASTVTASPTSQGLELTIDTSSRDSRSHRIVLVS